MKTSFEKTCAGTQPFSLEGASAWGGVSPGVTNSRFQDAKAAGLAENDVPKLKLKWAFNLERGDHGTRAACRRR